MSQDPGAYSARRPRETLGGLNFNSGIPQPASAMKRKTSMSGINNAPPAAGHVRSMSGGRHSIAPGRPNQPLFQRSSSGTNLADVGMSSVKRTSYQNSGGRKSIAPGTMARASGSSSERRSSVYRPRASMGGPMGHQSFFQQMPQPAGVPHDPRPLRDRAYQAKLAQELLDYMVAHNFEMEMKHMLSQDTVRKPTQKDFNYMFQWLYHRIDPSYRFLKNIDQEVPPILKQLRYPYEKGLTKSQIASVGGQNWSTFLGMLHWMMQLAQMMDGFAASRYDDACLELGVDVGGHRIIFDFLTQSYRDWLSMDDDADDADADRVIQPHVEDMARAFDRSNSRYLDEMKILEAENQRLHKEIDDHVKSTPDVGSLDDYFKILEDDKHKFEEFNTRMTQKSEKLEARIQFLEEEVEKVLAELKAADEERAGLQKSLDDKGISMQDIDRMTAERERLQKGLEVTTVRLDEAKRKVAEKELEASQRLDELEQLVDQYNALGYKVGVIPTTAANSHGHSYEVRLIINDGSRFTTSQAGGTADSDRLLADPSTGYHSGDILNIDLRGHTKNSLMVLRKEISERRSTAVETMMKNHDLLDNIKEAIEDRRNECDGLEHRVRAAQEEFDKTKEVTTTQKIASDAQIEKLEKELAKMRAGLTESIQLMEQREMNTNLEHEQLTLRANVLREELHTEIERMLNDIIKFKVHIQKSLEDYETFVTDELEHEQGRASVDDAQMDGAME